MTQYKEGQQVIVAYRDDCHGWKPYIKIGNCYKVTMDTREYLSRLAEDDPHKYYTYIYLNDNCRQWALPNCCLRPVSGQLLLEFMYK